MKQLLQNLKNGETTIVSAPTPKAGHGQLLVSTTCSLISAGTERMLVDFGKASYLAKARQQPEKVKQVLDKIKTNGLASTMESVLSKLSQPMPLGYCNVGIVSAIGAGVEHFHVGDRVVSNGPHADVICVGKQLCTRIPSEVDDDSAAFAIVASIGLQGVRLINPTLGERVVVMGVGLIGLLTVQLLRAQGCHVLAIDFDSQKLELARAFGASICNLGLTQDPITTGLDFSRGHGVDAVIITASTASNDPIMQAARMSRKRGRIVLVGVVGLALNRADFYEKELTFQVSCSYGPGRYDPHYEQQGLDYPIGFVRWTEQRNIEACLELMVSGQLNVAPLISHRYLFEHASTAYHVLLNDKSALGIVLQYTSDRAERHHDTVILREIGNVDPTKPVIGFIGAGNYASRVLLPAFKHAGASLKAIATASGINAVIHGDRAGFSLASTDTSALIADSTINTIVIATRHDSHASFVIDAMAAGKHVFVEKPLALTLEQLAQVEAAYHTTNMMGKAVHLMVGFNRRFAPHVCKMQALLRAVDEPKSFIMTINAGQIPADHWTQDRLIGGGRIIGEACHFIDLMRYLADSCITSLNVQHLNGRAMCDDNAMIMLGFADGSVGSIHYLANGASSFPKERIEVFTAGRILQLDNFRQLSGFGWPKFKKMSTWRQNKGQHDCVAQFLLAIEQGLTSPIPASELFEVTRVSIQAAELIRQQSTC